MAGGSGKAAKLILEDGSVFTGYAFGSETSTSGEVGMYTYFTCYLADRLQHTVHMVCVRSVPDRNGRVS